MSNDPTKEMLAVVLNEEAELEKALQKIPVALADASDNLSASAWEIAGAIGAVSIEFVFGREFFKEVMNVGEIVATFLPVGFVAGMAGGLEIPLELAYRMAQKAVAERVEFLRGPSNDNVLEDDKTETACKEARNAYLELCRAFGWVGSMTYLVGVVCLVFERLVLTKTSAEEVSWLTYAFNLAFTVGGALIAAVVLHNYVKRNSEVKRIQESRARLKSLQIKRINLIKQLQGVPDNEPTAKLAVLGKGQKTTG